MSLQKQPENRRDISKKESPPQFVRDRAKKGKARKPLILLGLRAIDFWEALTKKIPGKIIKAKIDFWVQFSIGVFYSIHSLKIKHIL